MAGVKTTREGQASAQNGPARSGPDGSVTADGSMRSERRAHLVVLAGELFAQKGYRATTVREIADAAGILSAACTTTSTPRSRSVTRSCRASSTRCSPTTAARRLRAEPPHRDRADRALNQPDPVQAPGGPGDAAERLELLRRPAPVRLPAQGSARDRADLGHAAGTWPAIRPVPGGPGREAHLPAAAGRLWIPEQWRRTRGYSTDQVVDAFLRILFDGIAHRD